MFKKIGYCIFALLLSVTCFAQFDNLQARFTNDSTGVLDTAGYIHILGRMMQSENDSYEVHRVLFEKDSSQSELIKMQGCKANMKLITIEKANLYGAGIDSATASEMSESDFNELWLILIPVGGLLNYLRKKYLTKEEAIKSITDLITEYFGKIDDDAKIDIHELYTGLTPILTANIWRNNTIKMWLEFNTVHFYKSWTKAKLLAAVTNYLESR